MIPSIFLSHNTKDKGFVRKLAYDLDCHGVKVWIDEAELKIGDSLIEKIREGIDGVDYVAVILSHNSINSRWVQKEIDIVMALENSGKKIKVLPLMLEECDLPAFLLDKKIADFTDDSKYATSFELVVNSMGVVFNKSSLDRKPEVATLSQAVDKESKQIFFIFSRSVHRPFQYIGMTMLNAAKAVGGIPNEAGNIIV